MSAEKQKTILLVEDEAIIAVTEKMTIEKYGYKVITAYTGEEAVALVEKTPAIDLILMDINLGAGIDGTEAAAIILKEHDIPVVFLSSHTEPEVVAKTEKITSYGYVVKNSSMTVLDASIKMAFKLFEAIIREKEKEKVLQDIIDKNPLSIQIVDKEGFTLKTNPAHTLLFSAVPPADFSIFDDVQLKQQGFGGLIERIKNGEIVHFPVTRYNAHDSVPDVPDAPVWIRTVVFPIYDSSGVPENFIFMHENITQSKEAEEALRESIEDFKGYFNMAAVGACITSLEMGWIEVNDRLCLMLGYAREELLRLTWAEMTYPDDLNADLSLFNQVLAGQRDSYELEKRFLCKDGRTIHTMLYVSCQRNTDKSVHHFLASLVDISELKRAEQVLRESEERFHSFFDNSNAGIYRTAPDGSIHLANPALIRMLGFSSFTDLADKNLNKTGFEPSYPRIQFVAKIEKDGEVKGLESAWKRKDGGTIIVRESARAIRDARGKTLFYDGIVEDITEINRSEKLTAALYGISQAMFNSGDLDELYKRIHGLIAGIVPADNFFIALLTDDSQVLKFPYYRDEKDNDDTIFIKADDPQSLTVEVLRTKKPLLLDEAQLGERYASGRNRIWGTAPKCWLGVPLRIRDRAIGVMVIQDYHDGSAYSQGDVMLMESTAGQIAIAINRKRAEEEIKRQLAEKEVLLREIHHRIKNNIASISGLLSLRLRSIANPEAGAALQDAIGRVDSMGLLYEKLMLSEAHKDVSVKIYAESLIDMVVAQFQGDTRIALDKRIDDFPLDPKRLFPLGIIINELLTNIMKYAFSGRETGSIQFSLVRLNGRITLVLQDDGRGLPPGFDAERSGGFGLMLVKMLSRQLGGSFSIENRAGTRCVVEFNA